MNAGIYLHVPFCRARCSYCDFNTYIDLNDLVEPYVRALETDIERAAAGAGHPASDVAPANHATRQLLNPSTLFFGGGTPSLLSPGQLGRLIDASRAHLGLTGDAEVTVECNPGTLDPGYLAELRAAGANRLSFGAQSANADELALLAREHDWSAVVAAVSAARQAGFDNVNLDLIFGLPRQSVESFRRTLDATLALVPDHLSLYALIIEQGTPMHDWTRRGEVPFPDPDAAADMYDLAEDALGAAGYDHYEISNWCKPGRECAHNLIYWRNEPYWGLGAGAHGSTVARREWRVRRPAEYIARVSRGDSTVAGSEDIDERTSRGETMMVGLRLLIEGVEHARFEARHGAPMARHFADELRRAERMGLLELDAVRARLTRKGRFISNQVLTLFV